MEWFLFDNGLRHESLSQRLLQPNIFSALISTTEHSLQFFNLFILCLSSNRNIKSNYLQEEN